MNFVLLERSVEESLRSSKVSESAASMISQALENQPLQQNTDKSKKANKKPLRPIENYSLLKNIENELPQTSVSVATRELAEVNNLDLKKENADVEEEPGFVENGAVNLKDLEDPLDLPDPEARASSGPELPRKQDDDDSGPPGLDEDDRHSGNGELRIVRKADFDSTGKKQSISSNE